MNLYKDCLFSFVRGLTSIFVNSLQSVNLIGQAQTGTSHSVHKLSRELTTAPLESACGRRIMIGENIS